MGFTTSIERAEKELGSLKSPLDVMHSRRSPVLSANGVRCSSQPLASAIGAHILAMNAAALNVTEPTSTGVGGDAFCHFYDAKTKKVACLQGNGALQLTFH